MRYEYIEPFAASTKKVLERVMHAEISTGEIALTEGDALREDVSIGISIKGDSDGCIIVSLDRGTAAEICRVMNGGDRVVSPALEADTVAELSNMIAGNATSSLNDLGYDFSVLPPALLDDDEVQGRARGFEIFRVPLHTPCGDILINVALRTS